MYLNENSILLLEGIIKDALKTPFFGNDDGKKKIAKNFNTAVKDFINTDNIPNRISDFITKTYLKRKIWNLDQANNHLRSKFNFNNMEDIKNTVKNLDFIQNFDKERKFEKFVKDTYGDEFKHYNAPDHKKIEVIEQLPNYWKRDVVLARADDKLIPFYRSTGMNGVKNAWFPFAGFLTSTHPFAKYYQNMDPGWIIKNALSVSKNGVTADYTLGSIFRFNDKDYRLIPFGDFPVNLRQVSDYLEKQNIPVSKNVEDDYNVMNKKLFDLFKLAKKL